MIITKTPLRVSLLGGGSDLPSFFHLKAGVVLSFTIDKFIYVQVKRRDDNKFNLFYGSVEFVDSIEEINHEIVKATLRKMNIDYGLDIIISSDIEYGTGLGSSSSLTVGLLNAILALERKLITKVELAELACEIEIGILNKPIGKQDQYAAAFGGLNIIEFDSYGSNVIKPNIPIEVIDNFVRQCRLFDTKLRRSAESILKDVSNMSNETFSKIGDQVDLARGFIEEISNDYKSFNYQNISNNLKRSWAIKKKYSNNVSNKKIEDIISYLEHTGSNALKLLGAGGGGMILSVSNDKVNDLLDSDSRTLKFKYVSEGSKLI